VPKHEPEVIRANARARAQKQAAELVRNEPPPQSEWVMRALWTVLKPLTQQHPRSSSSAKNFQAVDLESETARGK
jgi:hypothetical protein